MVKHIVHAPFPISADDCRPNSLAIAAIARSSGAPQEAMDRPVEVLGDGVSLGVTVLNSMRERPIRDGIMSDVQITRAPGPILRNREHA